MANCSDSVRPPATGNTGQTAALSPQSSVTPQGSNQAEAVKAPEPASEVPPAFAKVDFRNHTYQTLERRSVTLRNGKAVFPYEHMGGESYDFRKVYFVDLMGKEIPEAIVELTRVECGGSCDGGSQLFYIYSIEQDRLRLMQRIEFGSIAYDCGLMSFLLNKRSLTVETANSCRFKNDAFQLFQDPDGGDNKFRATTYSHFDFELEHNRFVLKKRKVLPNPQPDTRNYPARIEIN